ncbi:MAG: nucleotidyltransferase domain-containing protein [Nitrospinae bacterium]|nr:nucleotidyltransferase domain-containing protein [Nitrospinota bacterium]
MELKQRVFGKTRKLSIERLKEVLAGLSYVRIALLFGSRAIGKDDSRSDYDLALLMDELPEETWGMQARAWADISGLLEIAECDLDIVDLKNADKLILNNIKESFVVLKGDGNEVCRLFEQNK